MTQKKKLLDVVRDKIRLKHYSYTTEKSYTGWIKRFILFHNKKHPIKMAKPEIEQLMTFLAVEKKVSPTTQNYQMRFCDSKKFPYEDPVFSVRSIYSTAITPTTSPQNVTKM